MNSTEFKWRYENANPGTHYFDQKTMKCFGDTMRNFGVCSEGKKTREEDGKTVEVFCLYRRRNTRKGAPSKTMLYVWADTFQRVSYADSERLGPV